MEWFEAFSAPFGHKLSFAFPAFTLSCYSCKSNPIINWVTAIDFLATSLFLFSFLTKVWMKWLPLSCFQDIIKWGSYWVGTLKLQCVHYESQSCLPVSYNSSEQPCFTQCQPPMKRLRAKRSWLFCSFSQQPYGCLCWAHFWNFD